MTWFRHHALTELIVPSHDGSRDPRPQFPHKTTRNPQRPLRLASPLLVSHWIRLASMVARRRACPMGVRSFVSRLAQ